MTSLEALVYAYAALTAGVIGGGFFVFVRAVKRRTGLLRLEMDARHKEHRK